MGDGHFEKSGGIILCTDSFTLNDINTLINILIYKFKTFLVLLFIVVILLFI